MRLPEAGLAGSPKSPPVNTGHHTQRDLLSCLPWHRGVGYTSLMTHTIRDKQRLLARVRRIRGQVEAIERALESEASCEKVMHLLAGMRGATAGLMAQIVEDHVLTHLVDAEKHPGALNEDAAEQLLEVVRTYLK